jgi:3-oxoacyl-[acyl-carrier-protein] synthase-3
MPLQSVITGTGSYLPPRKVSNDDWKQHRFYDRDRKPIEQPGDEIVAKFVNITGITERRHVADDQLASDIATFAAEDALASSGTDRETLDYLLVAHNFGDVAADNRQSNVIPSIASRVKAKLGIHNPGTVAYDLLFGCPGWLQAVIQTDYFLRSGDARRVLVVGTETLSRVSDPHDRDSMIYGDGAGAVIFEGRESDGVGAGRVGILAHATRTDTIDHAWLLYMDSCLCPERANNALFFRMDGHKVYEYAVKTVPIVVLDCLQKAGLCVEQVDKILIHQANAKMDEAIIKRLLRGTNVTQTIDELVPMTVGWLGNSSVATLPTLLDLLLKRKVDGHEIESGDVLLFASVGAGMNINALAYRVP